MSIHDTYKELLKPHYIFCDKGRGAFIKLRQPAVLTNIDELPIGIVNAQIAKKDEELQRALTNSWLPGSVRDCIHVIRRSNTSTAPSFVNARDYWLVAKLTWQIQQLCHQSRGGIPFLTKATSPRQVPLPAELVIHLGDYNAVRDAYYFSLASPHSKLPPEKQEVMDKSAVVCGDFWSLVTKELTKGNVEFYEHVMDIYRDIHAKVPLVELESIILYY